MRARRDARRGLACARALEHVANIGAVVFDGARKVGMSRTRPRDDGPDRAGRARRRLILGVHRLLPVFPVLVADQQRDGRAECFACAHTRQNLGLVGFDRHAPAAAVSALTPLELFGDRVEVDVQSGRHAFENDDETLAVRLAGSEKTQHCLVILYEVSALFRPPPRVIRPVFAGERIAITHVSHGHIDCRSVSVSRTSGTGSRRDRSCHWRVRSPSHRCGRHARRAAGLDGDVHARTRRGPARWTLVSSEARNGSRRVHTRAGLDSRYVRRRRRVSSSGSNMRARLRRGFSISPSCRMRVYFGNMDSSRATSRSSTMRRSAAMCLPHSLAVRLSFWIRATRRRVRHWRCCACASLVCGSSACLRGAPHQRKLTS